MQFLTGDKDTICAVSTAPGRGGISVIRVSGSQTTSILRQFSAAIPESPESHRIYFGNFKNIDGESLDEVLFSYFANGKSFTGEETVEISCHGNPTITAEILKVLVNGGCRLAGPGEFTFRAFMNGRIDLAQAESVLSLIESQSKKATQVALRQLKGELSTEVAALEENLTWVMAHLEAGIDFSSEDIEWAEQKILGERTRGSLAKVRAWLANYDSGRLLREGCQVALVGQPNVGKSSLLNALLGEDRAIVTDEPGTTRDRVEAEKMLAGVVTKFVDTAGLRETSSQVEKLGIQRAYEAAESADIVLFVYDLGKGLSENERQALEKMSPKNLFVVGNKQDTAEPTDIDVGSRAHIKLSAKTGDGLQVLEGAIKNHIESFGVTTGTDLFQARHFEILKGVEAHVAKAAELLDEQESPELPAFELQAALKLVYEIRGKVFDDEVLDRVFSEFCLGK